MKKRLLLIIPVLALLALSACSKQEAPTLPEEVSGTDVSFTDAVSPSDSPEEFNDEQLRVIDMLEGNALALMNGESQMYMASVSAESPQYAATQQYAVELCEKYDMDISLDVHSVEINDNRATVLLTQTAVFTEKDGGAAETYISELKHEMISYEGIWNILSTDCVSSFKKHDPNDIARPVLDCADAMNTKDLDRYMSNISRTSPSYDGTYDQVLSIFYIFGVDCVIDSWEVVSEQANTATLEVVQKMYLTNLSETGGDVASTDRMLYTLSADQNGVWYIESTEILEHYDFIE